MSQFISEEQMEANRRDLDARLADLGRRAVAAWRPGMTMGELADVLGCGLSALAHAWTRHVLISTDNVATYKDR
jgi:uncharacterized membrane protein YccC